MGLYSNHNAVACREIDWNGNLPLAHQAHDLVAERQVSNDCSLLYLSHESTEDVAKILSLAYPCFLILKLPIEEVQCRSKQVLARIVDVEINCHCLVYSDSSKLVTCV